MPVRHYDAVPAYYNELDPKAAAWLRELIHANLIAPGDVDERSILDVTPSDLAGYDQCHFFAGIGGWSYALRLSGWPDDRPVWTGSCPCQPFSAAGRQAGFADERHLWPSWAWLIQQRRPSVIFGEQVASAMHWIDLVQGDLEAEGYACGYVVLGAHSVGAPHIRQRLYFVADANDARSLSGTYARIHRSEESRGSRDVQPERCGGFGGMGDDDDTRLEGRRERRDGAGKFFAWEASLVECRDGKRRPTQPGIFPLAHGVPGRVGLLRGYGNAIVPQVAATFIEAYLDGRRE